MQQDTKLRLKVRVAGELVPYSNQNRQSSTSMSHDSQRLLCEHTKEQVQHIDQDNAHTTASKYAQQESCSLPSLTSTQKASTFLFQDLETFPNSVMALSSITLGTILSSAFAAGPIGNVPFVRLENSAQRDVLMPMIGLGTGGDIPARSNQTQPEFSCTIDIV